MAALSLPHSIPPLSSHSSRSLSSSLLSLFLLARYRMGWHSYRSSIELGFDFPPSLRCSPSMHALCSSPSLFASTCVGMLLPSMHVREYVQLRMDMSTSATWHSISLTSHAATTCTSLPLPFPSLTLIRMRVVRCHPSCLSVHRS